MERVDKPSYRLADDEALALVFRQDGTYEMISGGIWIPEKVYAALLDAAKAITHREIIYTGGKTEYREPIAATEHCFYTTVPCGFASCEVHYGRPR
jgi:hypothetical protein